VSNGTDVTADPLGPGWGPYKCAKHVRPVRATHGEVASIIEQGQCPCCPDETLEATSYVLAGKMTDWSRCQCCGTDWILSDAVEHGWVGLPWIPRAMLIDQGLVIE